MSQEESRGSTKTAGKEGTGRGGSRLTHTKPPTPRTQRQPGQPWTADAIKEIRWGNEEKRAVKEREREREREREGWRRDCGCLCVFMCGGHKVRLCGHEDCIC